MSRWHRVDITSKQMSEIWKHYDQIIASMEGRVKVRTYRSFMRVGGNIKNESVKFGTTIPREEITYVFKFKNPLEAMAFKLEWS